MASVLAGGPGGGRAGVDRGGRPAGRGRRIHRRARPDRGLPGRQRPPGRSPAAFHHRVHRDRDLAAPAATARAAGGQRRGGPGRLAELAAYRRAGPEAGPARPDRGRPARGHGTRDPGRRRGDQGRRLPGGGRGVRDPGHAVVGRGGRRHRRVRFVRTGRADHRLPAGPRRGPAAQAGARRRPHGRSGADREAGRGLRRGRCAAAGVRRGRRRRGRGPGRLLRAVPAWRPRAPRRAGHGHAQLGRTRPPVPAQLRLLPRGRLRTARRRAGRPARSGARRRHPPAQPRGHAGPDGLRARGLSPAGRAGRANPGIDEPHQRRARHHRRTRTAAAGTPRVAVRPLAAPTTGPAAGPSTGPASRPARRRKSTSAARSPSAPWCSSGSAARTLRPGRRARPCSPAWSARTCWPPERR